VPGGGPIAPRGELPLGSVAYRTIGPFDAQTLPAGLRAEHRLKEGTWGVLTLSEGSLRFVWDDDEGGADDLVAPARFVVPPQAPHHVEGDGPFTLTIAFCR
jgi:cupin 2 domain-containing protein